MSYNIDIQVPISFRDGQIICQVNGTAVDLMKLDTGQEFKTVLWALAAEAFASLVPAVSQPQPQAQAKPTEPDLSQYEQQIGAEFQRQHDEAKAKLQKQLRERLGDAEKFVSETAFGDAPKNA